MKTSTTHRLSRLIKHLPSPGLLAAAALLFPAFLPLAGAQSSWTGATDGTWGTANNWDPSGVPGASSPGVALTFGTVASGIYSVDLGGVTRFATGTSALTFSSSNDYTFTNGSLTLANAAGMAMNGSGDAIFNIPVTFGGSGKALSGSGSGALIFNGAVTRGGGTMTITTHVILGGADDNSMGSATLSVSTGGILEVAKSSSSAQGNALGSGEISLINGGVLRISNSSAVFTDNNISVGGGEGSIEANQNASFKNLNANGIRTITFTGPATVTFTGDLTQTTATAGTRNTTLTGAGNAIINGTVNNNSGTSLTSIIKSGAGTVRFNSTTSNYTGSTTINAGVLEVAGLADGGTVSSLGQATNAAANLVFNGGTLRYVGAGNSTDRAFTIDAGGGTLDASGTGALTMTATAMAHSGGGTRTLTLTGTNTGNNSLATAITNNGANATSLAKTGSGSWALTNTSTYTGSTTISAGTLVISGSGSINDTSGVTLNGSNAAFRYSSSTNFTAPLTWTQGRLEGTNWNGSLANLTIVTNQIISPGNSPGTAFTTSQTWAGGGSYIWEINDATGTAGSDPGWDLVSGTGTLTITATDVSQFTIYVTSLTLANEAGNAVNFDGTLNYQWLIADFATPISGFSADRFAINTDNFANLIPPGGFFSVVLGNAVGGDNTQIFLTYNGVVIPEPSAGLLLILGVAVVLWQRRFRSSAH